MTDGNRITKQPSSQAVSVGEAREMSKWRRASCLACLGYSSCMILVLSWWSKRSRPEHRPDPGMKINVAMQRFETLCGQYITFEVFGRHLFCQICIQLLFLPFFLASGQTLVICLHLHLCNYWWCLFSCNFGLDPQDFSRRPCGSNGPISVEAPTAQVEMALSSMLGCFWRTSTSDGFWS